MNNRPKHRNPIDFIRTLGNVTLPAARKERMRLDLSAYADLHAIQDKVPAARSAASSFSVLMFRTRSLYAGALALVLIVSAGTQASFASEGAVPGDVLYPVKVAMAEPIALALTMSAERKAELSARFASRRVGEAAALSTAGKLDEKTADELAARFDTHLDALAKETDELEAKGDIAVSLAVRTDLEQKVSAQVEGLATASLAAAPASDTVAMKMAAVAVEAPADQFSARIYEKSRTLATTRERLDSALALDSLAEGNASVDLAVLRHDAAAVPGEAATSVLFFSKQSPDSGAVSATMLATSTATSTATTTEPQAAPAPEGSAASRFFAPFIKR